MWDKAHKVGGNAPSNRYKVSFCRNDEGIGDEGSLIPFQPGSAFGHRAKAWEPRKDRKERDDGCDGPENRGKECAGKRVQAVRYGRRFGGQMQRNEKFVVNWK